MPGMCEKKCGECGLCIGHQAQGVIDEKDAEINDLKRQVGKLTKTVACADAMAKEYFFEVDNEWGTGEGDVDMSKSKAYTAYMNIRKSNEQTQIITSVSFPGMEGVVNDSGLGVEACRKCNSLPCRCKTNVMCICRKEKFERETHGKCPIHYPPEA